MFAVALNSGLAHCSAVPQHGVCVYLCPLACVCSVWCLFIWLFAKSYA